MSIDQTWVDQEKSLATVSPDTPSHPANGDDGDLSQYADTDRFSALKRMPNATRQIPINCNVYGTYENEDNLGVNAPLKS